MIEKIIPHPLKPIVLKYDEEKKEQEFEINLVEKYIKLHDYIYKFYPERDKLLNLFKELDEHVLNGENALVILLKGIESLNLRATKMISEKATSAIEGRKLMSDVELFYPQIEKFHTDYYEGLTIKRNTTSEVNRSFTDEYHQFRKEYLEYNEMQEELNKIIGELSIDSDSYRADKTIYEEYYKKYCREGAEMSKMPHIDIKRYDELINNINQTYKVWEEINPMLGIIKNGEYLIDTTLSESFIDILDAPERPKYLILPQDKKIKNNEEAMRIISKLGIHTVLMHTPLYIVKEGKPGNIQDVVLALQHYPLLIERSIFAFEFVFEEFEGGSILISADEWKQSPEFMLWFRKMYGLPFLLFFLNDRDARTYFLIGDLIAAGKMKTVPDPNNPKQRRMIIDEEYFHEIAGRLFHSCLHFLIYCHNTGFHPEPYIEGILADFDMGITYEQVNKEYIEKINGGFHYRVFSEDERKK